MLMTSGRLILLRLYNITLGRYPLFSNMLRKVLVAILVKRSQERYVASSRFFDPRELEE